MQLLRETFPIGMPPSPTEEAIPHYYLTLLPPMDFNGTNLTKEQLINLLDPIHFGANPARLFDNPLSFDDALDLLMELGHRETNGFALCSDDIIAYRTALSWLLATDDCPKPFGGLYVWGPTGTGKTMLVRLLQKLSRLLVIRRPFWVYTEGTQRWRIEYYPLDWSIPGTSAPHARDYISHFTETGTYLNEGRYVMHIGDLGAEPREAMHYGSRSVVLADLIGRRSDLHNVRLSRPMVITSNYAPTALSSPGLYDDRTVSRILGDCVVIQLSGGDHRLPTRTK